MRILIAGCGDIGTALGAELAAMGHDVWGIRRTPGALPSALRGLRGDLTRPATLGGLPRGIDVVVYAAGPDASTDDAYRAAYVQGLRGLLQVLAPTPPAPRRIVFASSTAVYGQTDGSWVDEASPTEPGGFRGRRLLEAERVLVASRLPATIVRLGGVTRGRNVPRTHLLEVAEHYHHFGGASPINAQNRQLLEAIRAELAAQGPALPVSNALVATSGCHGRDHLLSLAKPP